MTEDSIEGDVSMSYKDKHVAVLGSAQKAGRPMTNLYHELQVVLKRHGQQDSDIEWIGLQNGRGYIEPTRVKTAFDVDYNSGYGRVEIDPTLIVRLSNGDFVTRWESEGMEGWRYNIASLRETAEEVNVIKVGELTEGSWVS